MQRALILSLALFCPTVFGQSTWTGTVSSNWSTAGNWLGAVPTSGTDAVIPAGTPNSPSTNGVAGAGCRDLTVNVGASLAIATGFQLSASRDVTVNGTISGTGSLRLAGTAPMSLSGSGSIGALEIAKGTSTAALTGNLTVTGSLTQTSGTFRLSDGGNFTMTVGGFAQFQGGTLVSNFIGILDVAGNVTFSGTSVTNAMPTIRCGGNWTSDINFAPATGLVVFDRAGSQTISGPGNFGDLTVAAGSSTSSSGGVHATGVLNVNGSLTVSPGALDVDGFVTVAAGGTLTLGNTTNTFGAGLAVSGGFVASGTIVFDGSTQASISSVAGLPSVQISKTANGVSVDSNLTISGNLTLTSGTVTVSNGGSQTVNVAGNGQFQGGTLVSNFIGVLDIAGNVTFSGTSVTGTMPTVGCGGNWSSDANFAPTQGLVVLHKTGAQTVSASGLFASLTVQAGSITSSSGSVTASGTVTVNGSLTVAGLTTGALTVNGLVTVTPGVLDANGAVNVAAGATLTLGTGTNTFGGDLIVNGTLAGAGATGTVIFDGSANGNFASVVPLPNVQIAKSAGTLTLTGNTTVSGNLTQTSGTLKLSDGGNFTMTVIGSALFQGGSLVSNFIGILDVAGNVTFSGTSVTNAMPTIRCGGNWSSDINFAPATGLVVFDRAGSQTISGPGNFVDLTVAAGSSTSSSGGVHATGVLNVNGSLTVSPGALDADGFVTVAAGGTLTLGNTTNTFGAGLAVSGGFVASGTIVFDGSTQASISSVASLPSVQISKTGTAMTVDSNLTISGNLTQTSGTLTVSNNGIQTVNVAGNGQFQGGTLVSNFIGVLDIAGNVTFSGTSVTGTMPTVGCGGNWSSDANFAPTLGLVVLHKTGAQTVSASGLFASLTVQAGSITSSSGSVTASGTVTVNGSLTVAGLASGALTVNGSATVSPGVLDANGAVNVAAGATLTLGTGTNTFGGDLIVNGTLAGAGATGTVVFDGSANGIFASVVPLPNVQIAKSAGSLALAGNTTVSGNLTQTSGTLRLSDGGNFTMTVVGSALFQGGTLVSNFIGILAVAGNVTFSGTSVTGAPPTIRCGGNWTSDANFAPTSGTVELNGGAATTIAHATPGGTITFPMLVISNGVRSAANDFTIASSSMTVTATGALAVNGGRHVRIHRPGGPTPIVMDGGLSVATNSELSMGPQTTAVVGSSGLLSLIGTAAQPARITGEAGGGYALNVQGALAANNFVVKEMGSGGMVVDFGSTIAVAPNNFQNGTFDFRAGAPAGSVLLDMRRQAPAADFGGMAFLNTPGAAGVFNVRTSASGVPISFTNWTGAFSGPSFENDPNNLVAWNTQPAPGVTFFKVRSGAERVEVLWRATNQANLTGFQVYRSLSASGPFTLVTTQGPGTPGNGFVDLPLAANQPVFEAVYSTMTQGDNVLFGSGSATPYSSAPPPNVKKVGGNGPFSDIQSAINASTDPNSVVWVTPGTYASFSIGAGAPSNLHVMGDSTGPVNVDTSAGPVQISNVPLANGVELSNLNIGTTATGQPGIVVTGCAGPVVLDALGVACSGAQTAVSVVGSTAVAVQRCTIQGGTGLSVTSSSHVALSRGSLTSLVATTSTIEMASLTPGSVNVTPAGSLQIRGLMPDLNLPEFASMAHPQFLTVDAFPNSPFIIIASPRLGYMDFPQFEMPVLVDMVAMATLPTMFTDFTGFGISAFEIEPLASILGFSFVVQVGVLDPGSGVWRFSNVETMVAMP